MTSLTVHADKLLALNKPKGYVVTRSDERGRKTVYDLLPQWVYHDGWMPIGRLDLESKGLHLFTRDGTNRQCPNQAWWLREGLRNLGQRSCDR